MPYLPLGPFIITMSESPEAPEELPENFETKVIAQLTTSVLSQVSCGVLYQLVQDKKAWKTQDAQAISFWRQERAELRLFA